MYKLVTAIGVRSVLFSVCAALCVWQFILINAQQVKYFPKLIEVSVHPGESIALGKSTLASPAADNEHVLIKRTEGGAWQIANISQNKQVEVSRNHQDALLRTITLKTNMVIGIDDARLHIDQAEQGMLKMRYINGQKVEKMLTYDGTRIMTKMHQSCPDRRLSQSMRLNWNNIMPYWFRVQLPMMFGGLIDCDLHLALAEIEKGAVKIELNSAQQFVLRAISNDARVCILPSSHGCNANSTLFELTQSFNDVQSVIIGRTHYKVEINNDLLNLKPIKRVQLFDFAISPALENIKWTMQKVDPWKLPISRIPTNIVLIFAFLAAAVLMYFVFTLVRWRFPYQSKWVYFGLSNSIVLFILSVYIYSISNAIGVGWFVILFSLISLQCLLLPISLLSTLSLGMALFMSQIGQIAMLTLGFTGIDTEAVRYFQSNSVIFSLGFCGLSIFTLFNQLNLIKQLNNSSSLFKLELGIYQLAIFGLVGLLMQFVFGDETGVFGFQPVEIAKFTLLILTAHVLSIRLDWQEARNLKKWMVLWLTFLLPIVMFIALALISLVMVHDFSPLLLIGFWACGVLFAWMTATNKVFVVIGLIILMVFLGGNFSSRLIEFSKIFTHLIPYSDRVDVWLTPELHPHTGAQVLQAGKLIQQGGMHGLSNAYGWLVPAVQDDFAPSWLMARFGAMGAVCLILLQTLHICSLLALGWHSFNTEQGDFRSIWLGRFKYFSLWGAAGLLIGHYIISWGTNLGWLPVMGQPMPFISYGGSLILFLLTPIQMLAIEKFPRN